LIAFICQGEDALNKANVLRLNIANHAPPLFTIAFLACQRSAVISHDERNSPSESQGHGLNFSLNEALTTQYD